MYDDWKRKYAFLGAILVLYKTLESCKRHYYAVRYNVFSNKQQIHISIVQDNFDIVQKSNFTALSNTQNVWYIVIRLR